MADVRNKSADKPLWKHIREKHDGRMEVEMFDHFRMELTGIFSSAQRRKANEGVRIAHLDPNTSIVQPVLHQVIAWVITPWAVGQQVTG